MMQRLCSSPTPVPCLSNALSLTCAARTWCLLAKTASGIIIIIIIIINNITSITNIFIIECTVYAEAAMSGASGDGGAHQ